MKYKKKCVRLAKRIMDWEKLDTKDKKSMHKPGSVKKLR